MILVGPGGDGADAFDIPAEEAGEQAGWIGRIHQELFAREVARRGGPESLAGPCPVRAIGETRHIGVLGDREGAVFAVIGEGSRQAGAGAIGVIGSRIAIAIIGDRGSNFRYSFLLLSMLHLGLLFLLPNHPAIFAILLMRDP